MKEPECSKCGPKYCNQGIKDNDKLPDFCPMINYPDLVSSIHEKYKESAVYKYFLNAAYTEKECYDQDLIRNEGKIMPLRPRIREISEFAKKIEAKKIGLAFCIGLADEATRATKIFESHGLTILSATCSCGAIDKTELGIPPEQKIRAPDNFEASCNPLLQAELFNTIQTDFNVIIGLCVGHDMLFTQQSQAPVTTLIVKDRLLGHNPVIALYSRYHKDIV